MHLSIYLSLLSLLIYLHPSPFLPTLLQPFCFDPPQQPPPQPPNALNIGLANGALNPQPSLISPLIGSQVTLPNLGMVGNGECSRLLRYIV